MGIGFTGGACLEGIDLKSVRSNGYSFQVEMTFRAQIAGFRIVEVPIIFVERRAGQSKMSKRVIWESMWMPLKLRAREGAMRRRIKRLNKAKGEKEVRDIPHSVTLNMT